MPSGRDTILVVDRATEPRRLVTTTLETAGYDVHVAASSADAERLLAEWTPAAIILGPTLPPDAGRAVRQSLAHRGAANVPIVVIGDGDAGMHAPDECIVVLDGSIDRADLLAAVWVATNP
jgi:DNA-binding response OmpR family regulator